MRSRFWTLIWILGILFPMAFLGRIWPAFGRLFNFLFAPDWVHVLMHALLYTVLAYLLAGWIRPTSLQNGLKLLGLILLVGLLHESLQLFSAGNWPGWGPELFDIAVDLTGGLLGLLLDLVIARSKRTLRGP